MKSMGFFLFFQIAGFPIIQTVLINNDSDCFKVKSFRLTVDIKEPRYMYPPLKSNSRTLTCLASYPMSEVMCDKYTQSYRVNNACLLQQHRVTYSSFSIQVMLTV